jgi:hypothetical protein
MSPSYWGPNTWAFFHTLTIKIKEESFPTIGPALIAIVRKICMHLPCPECASHAKEFWGNVNVANIKTKTDFMNLIFVFHNMVNRRKKMPLFLYDQLIPTYESKNLVQVYREFVRTFHTRGNMQLLNEAFHRNVMLSQLKVWMTMNMQHFNY